MTGWGQSHGLFVQKREFLRSPSRERWFLCFVCRSRFREKSRRCFLQQARFPFDHRTEVHTFGRESGMRGNFGGSKDSLLVQLLETDQQRIAGLGREALERRVGVTGGIQREHLPQLLSSFFQEIDKGERFRSEVADAKGTGKASGMEQDAAGPRKSHEKSSGDGADKGYRKSRGMRRACELSPLRGFSIARAWHSRPSCYQIRTRSSGFR